MENIRISSAKKSFSLNYKKHFANLAKINEDLNTGAREDYEKLGLTYVDVPEIVGITGACENIDTLFKMQNRLDIPLFFTQTGQLALEQSLKSFHGVWTVIHSGRDEEEEDFRHLRQFRLTEEEFDCTLEKMTRSKYDENKMFEALLKHVQMSVQSMIKKVLKNNKNILRGTYKRDTDILEVAVEKNFYRIRYEEAVRLLNKNGFPDIHFGDDLNSEHEAKIVSLLNKKDEELPVFITHYPKEIKFFNMKVSTDDTRVVLSADLIFPYAGEGTGSAVREHDFKKLNDRLITSTMFKLHVQRGGKYGDFGWYLDIIKNKKSNPHAGYGIGNERVLQFIFAERDIRNVSLFSLLNKETGDWDKRKYGQASIITSTQKHILLSIGKVENKKYLLPHIKKLVKENKVVLYATDKTHYFLKQNGVLTSKVYKISEIGQSPNISDLLSRRVFDLIVNIPTHDRLRITDEFTDGRLIRKGAVKMGTTLITEPEVTVEVFNNLLAGNG